MTQELKKFKLKKNEKKIDHINMGSIQVALFWDLNYIDVQILNLIHQ
jgi:hypothetical protein